MTKKVSKKPSKKQKVLVPRKTSVAGNAVPSEAALFKQVSKIIEKRRYNAGAYANREITLMYWETLYTTKFIEIESVEAN
jgi:hypothetical protein